MGNWHWTRDGERIGSISMNGGKDRIVLAYRSKRGSEEWQDVKEPIAIRWSGCRFGGEWPYFVCPGVVNGNDCARTVVKLYCAGRYYLCRHCYRLAYASQAEDRWDRASRRANKHRRRLLEFDREREGIDLSKVVLTHHSLKNQRKRALPLGGGETPKLDPITKAGTGSVQEKEKARLAEIIKKVNDLFEGDLSDQDKLVYVNSVIKGKLLESEMLQQQATNSTKPAFPK